MILFSKVGKHKKKKLRADLQKINKSTSVKIQNNITKSIVFIDENNIHPRRTRCKYFGEMIQMDASS
ncbi:hypothetical protein [Thomasclavelia spiroformis]|uniref:hypothetical protein n=1 Tax=Thomasclavelia spiroformis TaxID=29348 RepID=UPI00255BF982|nr:hypothetical protein [Thomasclavelia spiroformis]